MHGPLYVDVHVVCYDRRKCRIWSSLFKSMADKLADWICCRFAFGFRPAAGDSETCREVETIILKKAESPFFIQLSGSIANEIRMINNIQ